MNGSATYSSIGAEINAIRPARTRRYEHAGATLETKRRQAAMLAQRKQDEQGYVIQVINDILVVDDDPLFVDFMMGTLHEAGYFGCAAYDGESALLAIKTARPALVLLDLHLPGLSGLDVMTYLRYHDLAHVPIMLMTADAAAQLPTSTFPECLLKPFDIDTLLGCIGRYVRPQRHARSPIAHSMAPPGATHR